MRTAEGLQQAALEEYGADLHVALRSRRDELLYLRRLTEMLFPFLMPPKATDCRQAEPGVRGQGSAGATLGGLTVCCPCPGLWLCCCGR